MRLLQKLPKKVTVSAVKRLEWTCPTCCSKKGDQYPYAVFTERDIERLRVRTHTRSQHGGASVQSLAAHAAFDFFASLCL